MSSNAPQIVAVPSASSYYLTKGKRYPLTLNDNARLGVIFCDNGHKRVINLDGDKSAHLWYAGELPASMYSAEGRGGVDLSDEDRYRWKRAGHFTFERVTTHKIHTIESAEQLTALFNRLDG